MEVGAKLFESRGCGNVGRLGVVLKPLDKAERAGHKAAFGDEAA